jgi:hypothetical protein
MKIKQYDVIGFDSETMQGPPITFQFYSEDQRRINDCIFIGEKKSAIATFFQHLKKLRPGYYRMYGHNLEFDMLSILWERRAEIRDGNINLTHGDWTITGRYSKPIFANISDGQRHIELVDSILWFQTSLAKAAEIVCPDLPKLVAPPGLGTTRYKRNDKTFIKYAMRDAEVAFFLGKAIERFHYELEVPPQISLASMAAAVFRLRYMQDDIHQPPLYEWVVGAAASYHGGVNRVRPDAAPAWHKGVTALDLSSAYPDALKELPDFASDACYKQYRPREIRRLKQVPEQGIYRISGRAAKCDWPALFDHDFDPLKGAFKDIWVTGYELNESLDTDEVKLASIKGYHYDRGLRKKKYSPCAAFVYDFYRLKAEASDPTMRYMYKILLNSLTGKFIQTSPDYTLVDGKLVKINRAGGLYHPFIASLITGHTRAHIHQVEHKYEAIHTATDGVFVPGHHKGAAKKELGAVVSEGYGDLALFRSKLYIFYSAENSEDGYESQAFAGKYILKCARHGFQGTVGNLEQMLVNKDNRSYKTNKPLKLKTALKKGEPPNKFVIAERKLRNLDMDFKVFDHA